MDINNLLQGFACDCGKFHTCNIDYVYIEEGAAAHLKEICKHYKNILLVADENTYRAAGDKTANALSDKNIRTLLFSGAKILVPNETAIAEVSNNLENIELVIGIGSGVIQDLCKYVSFENKLPYIIVATAPSMDGYASDGAAMITNGMKVTYKAGLPRAIIADTQVLANAPIDMLQAGYGDIIGKFSALNDWKLSHCVTNEYFCDRIYDATYEQIKRTLALSQGILKRDKESIKALMEALVIIGIMMSFAGSSRPASGSEHHLSHFFEITGILDGTAYFSHGIDVAYSTVITAQLRQRILSGKFPTQRYHQTQEAYRQTMQSIYKSSAQGCIALQEKARHYATDRTAIYLEKEAEIREILSEMPSEQALCQMLSLVGLDICEFYQFYGNKRINDAIGYAKDLKDRYTVLWMYYDFYGKA